MKIFHTAKTTKNGERLTKLKNLNSKLSTPFHEPIPGGSGFHCGAPKMSLVLPTALVAQALQIEGTSFPEFSIGNEKYEDKLRVHGGVVDEILI